MQESPLPFLFDASLAPPLEMTMGMDKKLAESLFRFFRDHRLFRWRDANNDCEDRANAICMLLDRWAVPNYKAWVFAGSFLGKNEGSLANRWNYHVASILPVEEEGGLVSYVLDPATLTGLSTLHQWVGTITGTPFCHYVVTTGDTYIFQAGKWGKDGWYLRNSQNFKWTIQGLSGINGASKSGQAQLIFCRHRVKSTATAFRLLADRKPDFLHGR